MTKWKKPNGTEIEVNDLEHNIKMAIELGWVKSSERKRRQKKQEQQADGELS